ncbi:MAG: hypothetical protein EBT54_01835, partial [Betaproteobacteria bacterium]|nr:hypothetical protein [Betaproteobacteria bacterium]
QAAALFLEGKADEVTASIEARMSSAAEALEYEQAALFRDQLSALAKVRAQQAMTREGSGLDDIDVLAVVQQGGMSAVGLALVRNGQHMGDRVYVPQHGQDADAIEVLLAFMEQRYAEGGVPPELVLNVSPEPGELDWLQAVAGRAVKVGAHPRADRRVWLKMAEEAALRELLLRLGDRANQNRRLAELADFLQLEAPSVSTSVTPWARRPWPVVWCTRMAPCVRTSTGATTLLRSIPATTTARYAKRSAVA